MGKRIYWVDGIKLIGCILVALGHFVQSMVCAGIYKENGWISWFLETIYCFHVPLFFIASGYLYQRFCRVRSFAAWGCSVKKRFLSLIVPYVVFTLVSWVLKVLFSDAVNSQAGPLWHALLISPIQQYWFLYCLFFLFCVTPTFLTGKQAWAALLLALALRLLHLAGITTDIPPIRYIMGNELWFVTGMCLCVVQPLKKVRARVKQWTGMACTALFLAGSILCHFCGAKLFGSELVLGGIACAGVVCLVQAAEGSRIWQGVLRRFAPYTFPIYLMHTIFAAGLRGVLRKLGCADPVIHTLVGIFASFVGPVLAAIVMNRFPCLRFCMYPEKSLKKRG